MGKAMTVPSSGRVVLPWKQTLAMSWANVRRRTGRSVLTLLCLSIVVAFLMSTLSYQEIVKRLMQSDEVHTQAVLERAGVISHDEHAVRRQVEQGFWLMAISGLLCLAGITNTILMSVFERFREIGTLKCLGARNRFVVRLFMVESVLVGFAGSLTGALIGYVLALFQAGTVLEFRLLTWSDSAGTLIQWLPVCLVGGVVLTVLAAIYPTYVAARMKPVDAMRLEM